LLLLPHCGTIILTRFEGQPAGGELALRLHLLVLKDILRRKRRVFYAAAGVLIGTMTVIGVATIALAGEARVYDQLEKYGPNLTIIPRISNVDMKLGSLSMGTLSVGDNYIPESALPDIRRIADNLIRDSLGLTDEGNIATVAPKLMVDMTYNDTSVIVVGIDPVEEYSIKTWWRVQDGLFIDGPDQALVGSQAAYHLGLAVGDPLPLQDRTVTVVGILQESGSDDDYQIFSPLPTVQAAFDKAGLVSFVDIRALCSACPVDTIADSVNSALPTVKAVAVRQVATAEMGLMDRMNKFMLALGGITLLVGLFGVVNTMMASVNERIKDIGIMRAVGASRNQILRLFMYESLVIGIMGGLLGYLAGTLLAFAVGPVIFEGITVKWVPGYLGLSLGLATLISVIAAFYPALKATRIKVADSFRSV
jgi:putative ABC transport system permease protein